MGKDGTIVVLAGAAFLAAAAASRGRGSRSVHVVKVLDLRGDRPLPLREARKLKRAWEGGESPGEWWSADLRMVRPGRFAVRATKLKRAGSAEVKEEIPSDGWMRQTARRAGFRDVGEAALALSLGSRPLRTLRGREPPPPLPPGAYFGPGSAPYARTEVFSRTREEGERYQRMVEEIETLYQSGRWHEAEELEQRAQALLQRVGHAWEQLQASSPQRHGAPSAGVGVAESLVAPYVEGLRPGYGRFFDRETWVNTLRSYLVRAYNLFPGSFQLPVRTMSDEEVVEIAQDAYERYFQLRDRYQAAGERHASVDEPLRVERRLALIRASRLPRRFREALGFDYAPAEVLRREPSLA